MDFARLRLSEDAMVANWLKVTGAVFFKGWPCLRLCHIGGASKRISDRRITQVSLAASVFPLFIQPCSRHLACSGQFNAQTDRNASLFTVFSPIARAQQGARYRTSQSPCQSVFRPRKDWSILLLLPQSEASRPPPRHLHSTATRLPVAAVRLSPPQNYKSWTRC